MEESYEGHAIFSEAKEVSETDERKPIVRAEWRIAGRLGANPRRMEFCRQF
jgi:hypothetical protein